MAEMNFLNVTPINSGDLVHKVFNKPGFIEKTAHRIRLVGYGFLLIAVLAIVIQFAFPFIENPPDLFMQLLFLLALWGIFEIFSIPLEHFHDFYVVDFEKNWVALSKKRFFYYQVKVLASFNQIKAIGASEQPSGLAKLLNFSKRKKYAIFIQTLKNQLIQISDYGMTIEEANDFCHRLYSTHFSGAAYIGGSPGMQIRIDKDSGSATTVPQKLNSQQMLISFAQDISQMFLALILSIIIFAVSIFLIEWAAYKFFDTNMQTLKQPLIQLFYHKFQDKNQDLETEPEKTAKNNKNELLVTMPVIPQVATNTVNINFNDKKIVVFNASETPKAGKSAEIDKNKTASTQKGKDTKPSTRSEQKQPQVATVKEDLKNGAKKATPVSTKSAEKKPQQNNNKEQQQNIEVASKEVKATHETKPSDSLINSASYSFNQPEYDEIKSFIPSIDSEVLTQKPQTHSYRKQKSLTIIPGRGLTPELYINTPFKNLHSTLGKPLSAIKSKNGSQFIYGSFSINTLNNLEQTIVKIVITSENFRSQRNISTPENLQIGDSLRIVENIYGPYTIIKNFPGLHYPEKGISFIAKPDSPDTIGAIAIYQAENL